MLKVVGYPVADEDGPGSHKILEQLYGIDPTVKISTRVAGLQHFEGFSDTLLNYPIGEPIPAYPPSGGAIIITDWQGVALREHLVTAIT